MLTTEQRKEKGRQNRERIAEVRRMKREGTYELTSKRDLQSGTRMPRSQREMQQYLSGKYAHIFRGPITREERRWWNNYWRIRGRGFTKPEKRGEKFV